MSAQIRSLLNALIGLALVLDACGGARAVGVPAARAQGGTVVVSSDGLWPLDLGSALIDNADLPDDLYRYEQADYGALGAAVGDERLARELISRGFLGGQHRVFHGTGSLVKVLMSAYVSAYLTAEGARAAMRDNIERAVSDGALSPLAIDGRLGDEVAMYVEHGRSTDLFDSALVVYGRQGRFSFGLRLVYQDGQMPQPVTEIALRALAAQARRLSAVEH